MTKDHCTIFYSWQSDIKSSRNFVEDCLKKAEKLAQSIAITEIDRDTQGLAGAPDIGDSIYEKIDAADLFVADVTIINSEFAGRKTPNPNVMIELGYAIKSLGWDCIVLIYNKDYGDVEQQPFDINHRRMSAYSLKTEVKAEVRRKIAENIVLTIEILKQEGRLHRGTPEQVKARNVLSALLYDGMKRIWEFYYEEYVKELDVEADFTKVSEAQISMIEEVKDLLSDEQYRILHDILFLMKMSNIGTDDKSEYEFAKELVEKYFDGLYLKYASQMIPLPIECILKESVIGIMNQLSMDRAWTFSKERRYNGKVIFSNDSDNLLVYSKDGKILCQGVLIDERFTGYREDDNYIGQYVAGIREGEGKELAVFSSKFQKDKVRSSGLWKDNKLVDGKLYSVLFEKEESGIFVNLVDSKGNMLTTGDSEFFFNKFDYIYDSEVQYYVANVICKNDEYEIDEKSITKLPKEWSELFNKID